MERPSIEVLIPLVEKSGAAVAPAVSIERGTGPATRPIDTRAAIRTRRERDLMDLNT
jgi:hypothetical protein